MSATVSWRPWRPPDGWKKAGDRQVRTFDRPGHRIQVRNKVVAPELGQTLTAMAGYRNRLMHLYHQVGEVNFPYTK
ncbi:MAG TPA: hypothetical protein DEA73_10445, partial [Peptococcaceae bacterium]|nr:hypothetical protein [Peptococcaceae bacterium]